MIAKSNAKGQRLWRTLSRPLQWQVCTVHIRDTLMYCAHTRHVDPCSKSPQQEARLRVLAPPTTTEFSRNDRFRGMPPVSMLTSTVLTIDVAMQTNTGFVTFGVHPVDTIKTKMSLIEGSRAPSLRQVVNGLVATDGYRGLFRGLGASIASSVPFSGKWQRPCRESVSLCTAQCLNARSRRGWRLLLRF